MNSNIGKALALNGVIVILAGFIAGFILGSVALGDSSGDPAGWRLAHMEGLLNGLLLFAVAGASSVLSLTTGQARLMAYSFIGMAYCNLIFGWMRGAFGASGLNFDGPLSNQISAFFGALGVPLGLIGLALVALGALKQDD